jgi:glycosyltransferase involved in cell wall biosynthesis
MKLSIIVPIHNEEKNIGNLLVKVNNALAELDDVSTEILFVDDGSMDHSVEVIQSSMDIDPRIVLIILTKNFGHQAALEAGMYCATGEAVITMDGDLQHPPEYIPRMVAMYRHGAEIVQMKRTNVTDDIKGVLSYSFYSFFNFISGHLIVANAADFRLMSRRVVEEVLKIKVKGKYLRVILPSLGFKNVYIEYIQPDRAAGTPSYTFYMLYLLAFNMIFKFTRFPIHALLIGGSLMLGLSMLDLVYLFVRSVSFPVPFSKIMIPFLSALIGVALIGIAIISWYLFLIIEQLRGEPDYIIHQIKKNEKPA